MRRQFFDFNDATTTEIYTLSLHDALPIFEAIAVGAAFVVLFLVVQWPWASFMVRSTWSRNWFFNADNFVYWASRSEEHTSELQSRRDLVCRLLLEKKK